MFPFKTRSLTHAIDDEIHRQVRKVAPANYWWFRVCDVVTRAGFTLGLFVFLAYFVTYVAVRSIGRVPQGELDEIVQGFAIAMIICIGSSVLCGIIRDVLYKDLEPIARRALPNVIEKLS